MKWKGLEGISRGVTSEYYPYIRQKGTRKTTKNSARITGLLAKI
jgi:hypothetical protein